MTPLRLRGLFQRRVRGDDALLELARLRFVQAGLAAEVYADDAAALDRVLGFVPPGPDLPTVHLDRRLNLLTEADRAAVAGFATRFRGRVAGLVVHDQPGMADDTEATVAALHRLADSIGDQPDGPVVFLEYSAGVELDWFVGLGERLADVESVSLCLDIGHIGIRHARRVFARRHPALDLASLTVGDPRLPALVEDVDEAVRAALPAVLDVTAAVGRLGKRLHFHVHDGHPLIRGLSDHKSFLTALPIPFDHRGRRSLDPLYGPAGAAQVIAAAGAVGRPDRVSVTMEIHEADGRLPLGDAAGLFEHWSDHTNAERANYWLSVLAQNARLLTAAPVPLDGPA